MSQESRTQADHSAKRGMNAASQETTCCLMQWASRPPPRAGSVCVPGLWQRAWRERLGSGGGCGGQGAFLVQGDRCSPKRTHPRNTGPFCQVFWFFKRSWKSGFLYEIEGFLHHHLNQTKHIYTSLPPACDLWPWLPQCAPLTERHAPAA